MKKILMFVILVIFVIITAMALHNTNKNAAQVIQDEKSSEEHVNTDVVITDSYFIQSTNDIYLNIDNYIGKTIITILIMMCRLPLLNFCFCYCL